MNRPDNILAYDEMDLKLGILRSIERAGVIEIVHDEDVAV